VEPGSWRSLERWTEKLAENPFKWAWRAFGLVTLVVALAGGVLIRLTDPDAFPSLWSGLWWAIQTVTTVGYGDVVPTSALGRITAAAVMLAGISFIAVTTAAITNAFVSAAARRRGIGRDAPVLTEIAALRDELAALREELRGRRDAGDGD
jgi:voltage-gated potassium channel